MKKLLSYFLAILTLMSIGFIPAAAVEEDIDERTLEIKGTELLTELLNRQFEANKTGELIDTSDILADTPETELYRQYLYWYSGKCSATEEYWTEYTYSLDFEAIEDGMLFFNADLSYGRTCSLYHSEAYGFEYRIKLAEIDGQYYISYIDSEEMNFYGFKNKISNGLGNPIALARENVSAVSIDDLDAMIADYVDMKEAMNSETINPAEVVDMEEEYEAYLEALDSGVNVETTSSLYSYDREVTVKSPGA